MTDKQLAEKAENRPRIQERGVSEPMRNYLCCQEPLEPEWSERGGDNSRGLGCAGSLVSRSPIEWPGGVCEFFESLGAMRLPLAITKEQEIEGICDLDLSIGSWVIVFQRRFGRLALGTYLQRSLFSFPDLDVLILTAWERLGGIEGFMEKAVPREPGAYVTFVPVSQEE